jgi:metallo-beta-lactamase class B
MRMGDLTPEDPQRDTALAFPPVARVEVIADGDTVRVGPLALVAHLTPGHSPGGTTWAWRSCEEDRCVDIVYADSQTPVSDDGFRFSEGDRAAAFERGLTEIETLACDLLVTPHPGASDLWDRVAAREAGDLEALLDPGACRRYAETWRQRLAERLERERTGG